MCMTRWQGRRVYPIWLYHTTVILGPLYNPAREGGPCPLCLERRWLAIRIREEQEALNYTSADTDLRA